MAGTFGRYHVLKELGQGGMGRVYQVYDPQLQRNLALKVILAGDSAKQKEIDRFFREAQATAKLDHPNIVRVYDIGVENNNPFFTMDYIEGPSLRTYALQSTLSTRHIVQIMIKISQAVHHAHQQGIIHRDLKPANIMITQNKEPKVMDFGLAKVTEATQKLSKTGIILGTLQYMPPEQAQGLSSLIVPESDVYSLGAILYELLAKQPMYLGATTLSILNQILNEEPTPPSQIVKKTPKKLENICLKALAKDKNQRYSSAQAFAKDLSRFLHGESVTVKRSHSKVAKKSWLKLATFLLSIAIGITIFVFFKQKKAKIYLVSPKTSANKIYTRKNFFVVEGKVKNALVVRITYGNQEKIITVKDGVFREKLPLNLGLNTIKIYGPLHKKWHLNYKLSIVYEKDVPHKQAQEVLTLYQKLTVLDKDFWQLLNSLEIKIGKSQKENFRETSLQVLYALSKSNFVDAWNICEKNSQQSPLFLYLRGKARLYIGDWERGQKDLQKAIIDLPTAEKDSKNIFYLLATKDWVGVYNLVLTLERQKQENLFAQALGKYALQNINPKSWGDLAHLWKKLAYNIPGAYVYMIRLQAQKQLNTYAQLAQVSLFRANIPDYKKKDIRKHITHIENRLPKVIVWYYKALLQPLHQSIATLEKIIAQYPRFTPAYKALGIKYYEKQDQKSSHYFYKLIELEGQTQNNTFWLGKSYIHFAKNKTIGHWKKSLQLFHKNPNNSHVINIWKVYEALAIIYRRTSPEISLRYSRIALDLCPVKPTSTIKSMEKFFLQKKRYYIFLKELFYYNSEMFQNPSPYLTQILQYALLQNKQILQRTKTKKQLAKIYAQGAFLAILNKKSPLLLLEKSRQCAPSMTFDLTSALYYFHKKQYAKAMPFFKAAYRKNPNMPLIYRRFLLCYWHLIKKTKISKKLFFSIQKKLELFFKVCPDIQYIDHIGRAINIIMMEFLSIEDPVFRQTLIDYWITWAQRNKSNSKHYRTWAYILPYIKSKQLAKALSSFNKAISSAPCFFASYKFRGDLFLKMGKKEKALKDYEFAWWLLQAFPEKTPVKLKEGLLKLRKLLNK